MSWGGVARTSIPKEEFNTLFRNFRRGSLQELRGQIIAQQSATTFPRPWAIFAHIDQYNPSKKNKTGGNKIRNFDCALLLKWTRDILIHQTTREQKLECVQLGVEMFDGMLERHTVGEFSFAQFLTLCESAGDLKTAIERFKIVLEKYETEFQLKESGSSSNTAVANNSSGGVADVSFASFLQNPVSYAWLLRIAYSSAALNQGFDTVELEESVTSIVNIVIPRRILEEIDSKIADHESALPSSSATTTMTKSPSSLSSSPLARLKRRRKNNNNSSNIRTSTSQLEAALVAPHDASSIEPAAVASSSVSSSSSFRQTHQTIPFSIATLLHLLRPYFRTDRRLQMLVDDYINPSFLAQHRYEVKQLSLISVSPSYPHLRFLKGALMSKIARSNNNYSDSSSSSSSSDLLVSKYLLRKISLHHREFLYSASEMTDGPRGSSKMLIIGGADNWDNGQPEFDRSELVWHMTNNQVENNSNEMKKAMASIAENHYVTSLTPVQQENPSRLPYPFTWTYRNPFPLANSIVPDGRLLDIFETLFAMSSSNSNNNSNNENGENNVKDTLHKLALQISNIPKHFDHRLEVQSVKSDVAIACSDSFEMLVGGTASNDKEDRFHQTDKKAPALTCSTLTSSSSTPELLHYLICAVTKNISPGSAVETICRMLISMSPKRDEISGDNADVDVEKSNNNNNGSLLLLPLDLTLATIVCSLLSHRKNSLTSGNSENEENDSTLHLAAGFIAHSSLVRKRRLESYRDAKVNGESTTVLQAVWSKKHFDHVFETNCMSEVQFLTFIGNELGPDLLVRLFRVSQQIVEGTQERRSNFQAETTMKRFEKKRWIEEEKKKIREEQEANGIAAIEMPMWLVREEAELTAGVDDEFEDEELRMITDKSPIVKAFARMKSGDAGQTARTTKSDRSEEDDRNISLSSAPLDTLVLNFPSLRQALQLTLLKQCATSSSVEVRERALTFAPEHCPIFDLACIGNFTGFTRYEQLRPSWSSLKDVAYSLLQKQTTMTKQQKIMKVIILDSSFIEYSERFVSLANRKDNESSSSSSSSSSLLLVPQCVLSTLDATATCTENAPIDVDSLSLENEVARTASARLTQLAVACESGLIDVVQYSEQLLAAALTRKNTEEASKIVDEEVQNLIHSVHHSQNKRHDQILSIRNKARAKDEINHLQMLDSQIQDIKDSPYLIFNDTNSIILDVAKLISLAAIELSNQNTKNNSSNNTSTNDISIDSVIEVAVATNDITLIDRISAVNEKEGFAIGSLSSVPLEVLRNPDRIEDFEKKQINSSVLSVLEESAAMNGLDEEEEKEEQQQQDLDLSPQEIDHKEKKLAAIREMIEERRSKLSTRLLPPAEGKSTIKKKSSDVAAEQNDEEDETESSPWQQLLAADEDDQTNDEVTSGSSNNNDPLAVSSSPSLPSDLLDDDAPASISDDWKAENKFTERFPPFERPGGKAIFQNEFRGGRLSKDELPLERALEGELDDPDDKKGKSPYRFQKEIIEARGQRVTPFRPGKAIIDESHMYRPAHAKEISDSAVQLSARLKATVPAHLRYSKYQANINDPRNAHLVETYKEQKQKLDRKNKR